MILDGIEVPHTERPGTIEELAAVVRDSPGAIVPLGSGRHLDFGNPLRRADCAIDLTAISRISAYNPADLTIHVEAGCPLAAVQSALASNGQILALDPWSGNGATIGGIVAANAQGPYRAVGSARDWIIGMKVVELGGRVSKSGGRVVKNVTGYDLMKLYTGSLGSLAIIAEISFKLRAAFPKLTTARARCEDLDEAWRLIQSIRQSPAEPVSFEWLGAGHTLWLRFGEHPDAVRWQIAQLPKAGWDVFDDDGVWSSVRDEYQALGPAVLRVIAQPSNVIDVIETYRPARFIVHAANGVLLMPFSSPNEVAEIRRNYRAVVERAPIELRRQTTAFGLTDAEFALMKRLKDAFDPEGRLNPGRGVDGERR